MPESYYPQMDEEANPEASPSEAASEREGSESASALLPKSVLGGKDFKVGDEVVLKIVHLYEDEVEVQYAPEKPTEKPAKEAPPSANDELDGMAEGNEYA